MSETELKERGPVRFIFAGMVRWVVLVGLILMFAAFALYATGALPTLVAVGDVPSLWHMSATELTEHLDRGTGWAWIRSIGTGDNLAFAALVFFPAATIGVIAITAALYARRRNWWYAGIALAESVVLILAATGIFTSGH